MLPLLLNSISQLRLDLVVAVEAISQHRLNFAVAFGRVPTLLGAVVFGRGVAVVVALLLVELLCQPVAWCSSASCT